MILILPACQEDKGRPIIEEDRMAQILADYYIEQATLSQFQVDNTQKRFLYYTALTEKYGCTEAEFDSSVVWYTKNLDVFEKVYEQAEAILEARKDSLTQLLNTAQ